MTDNRVFEREEIEQAVKSAFASVLEDDVRPEDLGPSTRIDGSGLNVTSVLFTRAIIEIEEDLDIEVEDQVLMNSNFFFLGDLIEVLAQSTTLPTSQPEPADYLRGQGHEWASAKDGSPDDS